MQTIRLKWGAAIAPALLLILLIPFAGIAMQGPQQRPPSQEKTLYGAYWTTRSGADTLLMLTNPNGYEGTGSAAANSSRWRGGWLRAILGPSSYRRTPALRIRLC